MTATDLPADTVWPIPTLGVAIVQGEMRHCDGYEKVCPFVQYWCDMDRPQGPLCLNPDEAQFVAPRQWAQYDTSCERCHGEGDPGPWDGCSGTGRQVWTVRWPCPHPQGVCVQADCPGFLSARATIQVVPVVGALHGDPGFGEQGARLTVSPSGVFLVIPGDLPSNTTQLPLDPLPTPGRDYAVIVRLAE